MAGILDYSTTPGSNTTINGIGIAGSSSIKNGDDALRQMMADTASAITKVVDKTAGTYSAVKADHNQLWRATGTVTINLAAAATLTEGWCLVVQADGGNVTVDPAGSEQINGAATLSVISGTVSVIICTGTAFRSYQSFDDTLLGGAAFLDVGTAAGTVAAGDDSRINGAVQSGRKVDTQHSLQGGGNLSADRTLSLVGDTAAPGNNKVYGTDGAGVRGWQSAPPAPDYGTGVAGIAPNTVGAYTLAKKGTSGALSRGSTIAGSSLSDGFFSTTGSWTDVSGLSGTWTLMSGSMSSSNQIGIFKRIS